MHRRSKPVKVAGVDRFRGGEERFPKHARTTGRGQQAGVRVDVHIVMPSGASKGRLWRPASARIMNWAKIGKAACAALKPTGRLSLKPTQTTVSNSGVKPTNHATRRSLVVPDLPAVSSVKPAARAPAPVPSSTTLRSIFVTRNVVSGRAINRGPFEPFFVTSSNPDS